MVAWGGMRCWSTLVFCLLMSACSLLFNPSESPSSDAGTGASSDAGTSANCGVFAALADDFQSYLQGEPQDLWTVRASNPPLIVGEAVHLVPIEGSASELAAQVPDGDTGSITIALGPQLSSTLLIFQLYFPDAGKAAQFHRQQDARGVYLFEVEPTLTTTVIDPMGSSWAHRDSSGSLRVTLSTKLAGEQLVVSYSIAGSNGEDLVTFTPIELPAGPTELIIQASWASDPADNDTIILESLSCP